MTDAKKPVLRKLTAGKLKRLEFASTTYRIHPEDGTTLDDVLRPEYWAHVGEILRPFDKIEVVFDDGTRFTELLVLDTKRLYAKVAVLVDADLTAGKKEAADDAKAAVEKPDYTVEYKGSIAKWSVIRASDNERVKDGMASRDEAEQYLKDYLKALAA